MIDKYLLIFFGALTVICFVLIIICMAFAMKYARAKDGELKMVLCVTVAMMAFIFVGMSWAYFVIPILLNGG